MKQKRLLTSNGAVRAAFLRCAVRFSMTAALTGSQTAGGYAPFALGCMAASGPGAEGFSALAGAVAGAWVFLPFTDALPFLAICVLILAATTAFRGNRILSRAGVISLTSVCLFLTVALIYVLESFVPREGLAPCLAAAGLTGASAWFLWPLLNVDARRGPGEGVLFLLAALLLATQEVSFGGFSPGRALLCLLLVWTAYGYGPGTGAAAGLSVGLTADLYAGSSGSLLTAAMGLSGLLSGQYHGGKRWRAALLYLAGTAAALLAADGTLYHPLLAESGAGTVLFLLLPDKLFANKPQRPPETGESRSGTAGAGSRLRRTAAALRDLYENCGQEDRNEEENPSILFDRAAERVCRDCSLCGLCWQEEYGATYQAISDAAPTLLDRGRALSSDFPGAFTARCIHLDEFLSAINGELTAFLLRRQYRRQLAEARRDARRQYAQFSELLSSAADGLDTPVPVFGYGPMQGQPGSGSGGTADGTAVEERPPGGKRIRGQAARGGKAGAEQSGRETGGAWNGGGTGTAWNNGETGTAWNNGETGTAWNGGQARTGWSGTLHGTGTGWEEPYRLGSALRAKQGERVCGDTMVSFLTENGLLCLLLADGMGSGREAREESALTCRLLRQFLDAGVHPEAALKTLNTAMSLRGEDTGSFTTVDLCTFDEYSGEASFYKYGAAPSYFKRGGTVRRIAGSSLPVGLRTVPGDPDVTRLRMEPGCFAVMISDGVADAGADGWLQELLADWEGEDPQALAVRVMEESIRRQALEDDCGVQILYWPQTSAAV